MQTIVLNVLWKVDQLPHFHSFPKDKELREKWIIAIRIVKFKPNKHNGICADHFLPEDYVVSLKQNSIPFPFDGDSIVAFDEDIVAKEARLDTLHCLFWVKHK